MGLVAIKETADLFQQKNVSMTERDREFVVQFAFRTDDRELAGRLIDELAEAGADRDAVCRKYQALIGFQPDWVRRVENLLISLEMYRVQEERAVKALSELLSACGIPIGEDEVRGTDTVRMQERFQKEVSL